MSEVSQPNELIETIKKALEAAEIGPWAKVEFANGTIEIWQSIDNTGIARIHGNNETASANAHLVANAPEWLRAQLVENAGNQQLLGMQKEVIERKREELKLSLQAHEHAERDLNRTHTQLEQVKAELKRSRGSHMFQYGLSLELEIKRLKAELENVAPSTMTTWTHDCREVNDLYGFQVVFRGKSCPFCGKTEASQ